MTDEEILEELDKRQRKIEEKEKFLQEKEDYILERETLIKQQNEQLKLKRSTLLKQQKSQLSGDVMSKSSLHIKTVMKQVEAEKNDLLAEIESLRQQNAEMVEKEDAISQEREEELIMIRNGVDKKMTDINLKHEILRQELEYLKQRKNSENETLRQQIEELRKQKNHLEAASRHNTRHNKQIDSARTLESDSGRSFEDDCDLEYEIEIAELREKIVEQERDSRKTVQNIASITKNYEEIKEELKERVRELREMQNQLVLMKEASAEKMKQKDETIGFMQNEMKNIMQEKQTLDKKLRETNLEITETQMLQGQVDDKAEQAKIEAINAQLRVLDDENRQLEDQLKEIKYNNALRLKDKQSVILELQDELSEIKWELRAREKGADYITLMKEGKERKQQLDSIRRELKLSQAKILELELQNSDLEREVNSMNKSDHSQDSGVQISGLKRQIKSLKLHNIALERKLDIETRDTQETLAEKEAKVRILESELEKARDMPQTSNREIISEFFPSLGRDNIEKHDQNESFDDKADDKVDDKGAESNGGATDNGSTSDAKSKNVKTKGTGEENVKAKKKKKNIWDNIFG
eukprot:CAMPEP_0201143382 /NCGR_PEP_ID=MMETSP0851-20130426/5148_1 /ASSEMBLY_ACC=CAM_ASM_000631 /TAXON_ID=183588 /ORGANISM="Pseudo-nitzschia fraudulenta, Strain WWA7" /LENGTH=582 /DNA_ID=CAMNT_0047417619 /DNA_START=8 /DNA_END=1756 /DNA_ORIENTATION=-